MKVVIANSIGGFYLETKILERLIELEIPLYNDYDEIPDGDDVIYIVCNHLHDMNNEWDEDKYFHNFRDHRSHPLLIQVIEELGSDYVKIVDIPDDIKWYISESEEGYETIHEEHRTWY